MLWVLVSLAALTFPLLGLCHGGLSWNDFQQDKIPAIDEYFPNITQKDVIRGLSPHGYRGNMAAVHAALQRGLADPTGLKIAVFGGSVTMGHKLRRSFSEAWVETFRTNLEAALPGLTVVVYNLASRATPSNAQCSRFHMFEKYLNEAHLVVVDISINDRPSEPGIRQGSEEQLRQSFQDISENQTLKIEKGIQLYKQNAEGRLLMLLLLGSSQTYGFGLLYFETFTSGAKLTPTPVRSYSDLKRYQKEGYLPGEYTFSGNHFKITCPKDIAEYYHWQALVEYKIPVFSYPDTVCTCAGRMTDDNYAYWAPRHSPNLIHHGKMYHDFVAKIFTLAIVEVGRSDLRSTEFDMNLSSTVSAQQIKDWDSYTYDPTTNSKLELDLKQKECALAPVTVLNFSNRMKAKHRHKSVIAGSAWNHKADVPYKYGWIVDSLALDRPKQLLSLSSARTITFKLLGSSPNTTRVELQLMKSYNASMGSLTCCIGHVSPSSPSSPGTGAECPSSALTFIFNTRWQDLSSQTDVVSMELPGAEAGKVGVERIATGKNTIRSPVFVRCTADAGKVKISGIKSC